MEYCTVTTTDSDWY